MKSCKKCGNPINGITVDGKRRDPKNRTSCFECVPFGTSPYTTPSSKEKKLIDNRAKSQKYYEKKREEIGISPQHDRYKQRRHKIIEILGSKCQICGYDRTFSALAFHHLNGEDKEQSLSIREFQKSPSIVLAEICKCILVCHNCHSEIHEEIVAPTHIYNDHICHLLSSYMPYSWAEILAA